jgi:hypothetical protein
MDRFASELFDSVGNTFVDGSFTIGDVDFDTLTPGYAANLNGNAYTIGWESSASFPALAITGTELIWQSGGGGLQYSQTISCTNRRAAYSAAPFLMPDRVGMHLGFQDGGSGMAMGGMIQAQPMGGMMGGSGGDFGGGGGMPDMGMGDMGSPPTRRPSSSRPRATPAQRQRRQANVNQQRGQAEAMGGNRQAMPVNPRLSTNQKPMPANQLAGYQEFGQQGRRRQAYSPEGQKLTQTGHAPPPQRPKPQTPLVQLPKPSTSFRDDMYGSTISTDQIASND